MSIEFQCPRCEATIRVPDSASGTTGSCPKCKARLRVPAVAGPPPARAAVPTLPSHGAAAAPQPTAPARPATGTATATGTFEFPCPLCTAVVLVPLAAAGKNGKCPHCSGRIRVPHPLATSIVPPASPVVPRFEPAPAVPVFEPGALPSPGSDVPSQVAPLPDFLNFAAQESAPGAVTAAAFNPEILLAGGTSSLAQGDTQPKSDKEEPSPRRRVPRRNLWAIVLPIAALALVVGGGLAFMIVRMTALEGELTAEPMTGELPRVAIDRLYVDVSDMRQLQDRLNKQPLRMQNGPLTEMNIAAAEGKLWVSIIVGAEGALFRIDPRQNPRLSKYIDKHHLLLDRQRGEDLLRDGPLFLAEIQRLMKESGGSSKRMQQFFETIGIATLTKGFGYHVWADRGDSCVYEDSEGRLYFVLPKGTTSFELTGRDSLSSGHQKFLGRFHVKVAGASIELPPVPPLPTPPKAGKEKSGEQGNSSKKDPDQEPAGMAEDPDKNEQPKSKPKPKKKKVELKND